MSYLCLSLLQKLKHLKHSRKLINIFWKKNILTIQSHKISSPMIQNHECPPMWIWQWLPGSPNMAPVLGLVPQLFHLYHYEQIVLWPIPLGFYSFSIWWYNLLDVICLNLLIEFHWSLPPPFHTKASVSNILGHAFSLTPSSTTEWELSLIVQLPGHLHPWTLSFESPFNQCSASQGRITLYPQDLCKSPRFQIRLRILDSCLFG